MNLLFMFEAQVAKDNPLLYHITNILLHIGCSLLVYTLFQQLRFSKMLSALAALVFCVHPLHTSAVAWIPGRNDTLLTLFLFRPVCKRIRYYATSPLHRLYIFCQRAKASTGIIDFIGFSICICHRFLVLSAKHGVPWF
jgi:hypothetical protein